MAYVTENKNVQAVIRRLQANVISKAVARTEIQAISPVAGKDTAWRDWEIEEAINAHR